MCVIAFRARVRCAVKFGDCRSRFAVTVAAQNFMVGFCFDIYDRCGVPSFKLLPALFGSSIVHILVENRRRSLFIYMFAAHQVISFYRFYVSLLLALYLFRIYYFVNELVYFNVNCIFILGCRLALNYYYLPFLYFMASEYIFDGVL